jgi:hypothetical protein
VGKRQPKSEKAAPFGVRPSRNVADLVISAWLSDMAHPIVVTGVTAAAGAGDGPVQNHEAR